MNDKLKIAKYLLIFYIAIVLLSVLDFRNEILGEILNYEITWLIYSNVNVFLGLSFLCFLLLVKEVLNKDGIILLEDKIRKQKLKRINEDETTKKYTNSKKFFTSAIGAANVTIFFFMPWLEFDCIVKRSITGAEIGDILWIIPFGAVVFICCFFIMHRDVRKWKTLSLVAFFSVFVSIIALVIKLFNMMANVGELGGMFLGEIMKHVNIKYGLIMVIIGQILLLVGCAFYYNGYRDYVDTNKENDDQDDIENNVSNNKFICIGCHNEISIRYDIIAQGKFFCPNCGNQNIIQK